MMKLRRAMRRCVRACARVLPQTHYCLPLNIDTHLIIQNVCFGLDEIIPSCCCSSLLFFCICIKNHWNAQHGRFPACRQQLIIYVKTYECCCSALPCSWNAFWIYWCALSASSSSSSPYWTRWRIIFFFLLSSSLYSSVRVGSQRMLLVVGDRMMVLYHHGDAVLDDRVGYYMYKSDWSRTNWLVKGKGPRFLQRLYRGDSGFTE